MSVLRLCVILCVAMVLTACSSIGTKSKASTTYSYEPADQSLTVTFENGSSYIYAGVPADVYAQVEAAESKGKAFNELVKGKYQVTKAE